MQAFIRDCWNKGISSDDFIIEFKQQSLDECELASYLVNLIISMVDYPTNLLDYFAKLLNEYPKIFITSLDKENPNHIQIIQHIDLKTIITNMNHWKVGDIEAAEVALKIIFCVWRFSDEKMIDFLEFIGTVVMFNLYLASSRVLLHELFVEAHKELNEIIIRKNLKLYLFAKSTVNFFTQAFFKNIFDMVSFRWHKIFSNFFFNFNYVNDHDIMAHLAPSHFILRHIVYHLISEYINEPNLLKGYIISKTLQYIYQTYDKQDADFYYELSEEDKNKFWGNFLVPPIKNKFLKKEFSVVDCMNFSNGASPKEIIDKYFYYPINIGIDKISDFFNIAIAYPSLTLAVPDLFIKNLTIKKQQIAFTLCLQALKNIKNFVHIMKESMKMKQFLQKLVVFMEKITDNVIFEPIWLVFLSCIKLLWMTGEPKLREFVSAFVEKQTKKLQDLLNKFLISPKIDKSKFNKTNIRSNDVVLTTQTSSSDDVSPSIFFTETENQQQNKFDFKPQIQPIYQNTMPLQIEFIRNNNTPYSRCLYFYEFINNSTINESTILIANFNYLWPIAIIWGTNTLSNNSIKFTAVHGPDNYFCSLILQELLYYLKPSFGFKAIPDFDFQVNLCIPIETMEFKMSKIIRSMDYELFDVKVAHMETTFVVNRAAIKVYGMKRWFSFLLSTLNIGATAKQVIMSFEASKIIAILFFGILSENREYCFDVLNVSYDLIMDNSFKINFMALAQILFPIFISKPYTDIEWIGHVKSFIIKIKDKSKINERCRDAMLCFAKVSIMLPSVDLKETENFIQLISNNNDPVSIINFYVLRDGFMENVKEHYLNQNYDGFRNIMKMIWNC